jgi:hypothetical protein
MKKKRMRVMLFLMLVSLGILLWGVMPQALEREGMDLPTTSDPPLPAPLGEARWVTFEYARTIRLGDSGSYRLVVEVSSGAEPLQAGSLYEDYAVFLEARLELPETIINPEGSLMTGMLPGSRLEFSWQVTPQIAGKISGMLWIYLRLSPLGGGDIERLPLLARPFTIEGVTFLGLSVDLMRIIGGAGFVLSFTYFLVIRRRRR